MIFSLVTNLSEHYMDQLQINMLRNDTPGAQNCIHFNNAGASFSPLPVIDAMKEHLDSEALIGGYEAAENAQNRIDNFYTAAAELINCTPEEIAFTENATRAWDLAFYSFKFNAGDKIITSICEYASNYLAFLHVQKHSGVIIEVVKNDIFGQLDIIDLQQKIDHRTKLIAITHVPTQGGLINPAEKVGAIARDMKIPYLLDTTQSLGQMPIDVEKIGCDFLCGTGRKFLRGPRGTGFLYARKEMIANCDPPFIDLRAAQWMHSDRYVLAPDAARFETWEQNIAAKIGLGVALDYANRLGIDAIWTRIKYLSQIIRSKLGTIPSINLHDLGENKCGIVTFTVQGKSPKEVQQFCAQHKINVSVSLQEYAWLDLSQRHLPALIRASVHYYNTEEEIERFVFVLNKLR